VTVIAPEEAGLDPSLPDTLRGLVERDMERGLVQGMQLFVARRGTVVVDEAIGVAAGTSTPITPTTRFLLASASKAITATALHLLVERGLVAYNDPVSRHVPAFGKNGKGAVTIRQVFTHQGGFPDLGMTTVLPAMSGSWETAVDALCDLELEYEPGTQVVYHGFTAFAALAEVVRCVDGRSFAAFCDEEIFRPLGMADTTWGLPDGVEATDLVGPNEAADADVAVWRSPQARGSVIPGANAHSTARDVGALYLSLSGRGAPPSLLSRATVEHATLLHAPMAPGWSFGFGYGFMVGTEPGAVLSRGNLGSTRTYGHPGMTFTQAMCDPRDDLVIVFLGNVAIEQGESDRRFGILCDAVYRAVTDRVS
jgi:CubicO group peptidase (beta-lactamase class C family)